MSVDLKKITTESRNKNTLNIDKVSTFEMLSLMNQEDELVAIAVRDAIPQIEVVVDELVDSFNKGGRLIYIGAGTSGRIGLMDAVECYPTFSVPDSKIMALMAGGNNAMIHAIEGAEDDKEAAINQLKEINLNETDFVIGIAASGRTPYTVSALEYANSIGAKSACITTSINSVLASTAKFPIEAITGAEVVMGSTRLKSGTAQKLICNMITTVSMIKMGKTYSNLLIDMQATNEKVSVRCSNVLVEALGISIEDATSLINKYGNIKYALFSYLSKIEDREEVIKLVEKENGNIYKALEKLEK